MPEPADPLAGCIITREWLPAGARAVARENPDLSMAPPFAGARQLPGDAKRAMQAATATFSHRASRPLEDRIALRHAAADAIEARCILIAFPSA